ncbi:hypothetical protein [Nereida sp. MMG025]|nr:hypothetical protein [Nereida sp. MMG025]MCF6443919.1 hypothetical protein [Nereida sp. MMG025]
MPNSIKLIAVLGLTALLAACGGGNSEPEEFVVVDPEPISAEPTFTGKYK